MTEMAIERPQDTNMYMGKFFLSKTTTASCIVLNDGSVINIEDRVERDCVGSALAVTRALKADNNNKVISQNYFWIADCIDMALYFLIYTIQKDKQEALNEISQLKEFNAMLLDTIKELKEQLRGKQNMCNLVIAIKLFPLLQ